MKAKQALSIAGFDPSGGAGVMADVKTFEAIGVRGFGVLSANTFQNDLEVCRVDWIPVNDILEQMDVLMRRFELDFFKIGIVQNSSDLETIKRHIRQKRPEAVIVWDPVLRSSSGFDFFESSVPIKQLLEGISLTTPNLPEFEILFRSEQRALEISHSTLVYRKGGHSTDKPGWDFLYREGNTFAFEPQTTRLPSKHGSGCVLSSALCAHLALGWDVFDACSSSKRYMESYLGSDGSLLGWHTPASTPCTQPKETPQTKPLPQPLFTPK